MKIHEKKENMSKFLSSDLLTRLHPIVLPLQAFLDDFLLRDQCLMHSQLLLRSRLSLSFLLRNDRKMSWRSAYRSKRHHLNLKKVFIFQRRIHLYLQKLSVPEGSIHFKVFNSNSSKMLLQHMLNPYTMLIKSKNSLRFE